MKILIVNANIAFNEAAQRLLTGLGEAIRVCSASSIVEAPHTWRQLVPDLIFMNMEKGCLDLSAAAKKELPGTKLIGMFLHNDDLSYYSFKPGLFDGFISKELFKEQVLPLIRTVAQGETKN